MLDILITDKQKPYVMCNDTHRVLAERKRHVLGVTADLHKNRTKRGEDLGNSNFQHCIGLRLRQTMYIWSVLSGQVTSFDRYSLGNKNTSLCRIIRLGINTLNQVSSFRRRRLGMDGNDRLSFNNSRLAENGNRSGTLVIIRRRTSTENFFVIMERFSNLEILLLTSLSTNVLDSTIRARGRMNRARMTRGIHLATSIKSVA